MSLALPSPGHQPTKAVGGSKHPVSQSVLRGTAFCACTTAFSDRNTPQALRKTTNRFLHFMKSSSYSFKIWVIETQFRGATVPMPGQPTSFFQVHKGQRATLFREPLNAAS